MSRPICDIAGDIERAWPNVDPYARQYLQAMKRLRSPSDAYGADDAESIVLRFLCNAGTFRGNTARRLKAELNHLLKEHQT